MLRYNNYMIYILIFFINFMRFYYLVGCHFDCTVYENNIQLYFIHQMIF